MEVLLPTFKPFTKPINDSSINILNFGTAPLDPVPVMVKVRGVVVIPRVAETSVSVTVVPLALKVSV